MSKLSRRFECVDSLESRTLLSGYFAGTIRVDVDSPSPITTFSHEYGDIDSSGAFSFGTRSSLDQPPFNDSTTYTSIIDGQTRFREGLTFSQLTDTNNLRGIGGPSAGVLAGARGFVPVAFGDRYVTLQSQATGLTALDRAGQFIFSGVRFVDGTPFPTLGTVTGDENGLSLMERSSLGDSQFSYPFDPTGIFDDGFTEIQGVLDTYALFGPGGASFIFADTNQTDGTATYGVGVVAPSGPINAADLDGRLYYFNIAGALDDMQVINPMLGMANYGFDSYVLALDGDRFGIFGASDVALEEDPALVNEGAWTITGGSLSFTTDDNLTFGINLGFDDGSAIVGGTVNTGLGSEAPIYISGAFSGATIPGLLDGGNTTPPVNADADVTYTSTSVTQEDGTHYATGTTSDGETYKYNIDEVEGSGVAYLSVVATIQDQGRQLKVVVVRVDGKIRELTRAPDGEWTVTGPDGDPLSSGQAPRAATNPVTGQTMQVFLPSDGGPGTTTNTLGIGTYSDTEPLAVNNVDVTATWSSDFDPNMHWDQGFTFWAAYHNPFLGENNRIQMLWTAPGLNGQYRVAPIADLAGAPDADPAGRVSLDIPNWGTIHAGYTDTSGRYINIYWNITTDVWRYGVLDNAVGAPDGGLNFDPSQTITTHDPNSLRLIVTGIDQTSGDVATVDWKLDRRQWQYTSLGTTATSLPLLQDQDSGRQDIAHIFDGDQFKVLRRRFLTFNESPVEIEQDLLVFIAPTIVNLPE